MAIVIPVISTFDNKGVSRAVASFRQLDGAGQKSAFALLNTTKAANSFGKSLAKMGGIVGGVAGVIGGTLINAARESEKVSRQTAAIIKATGGSAQVSSEQISKLAETMSYKTGIDDEAIQSSMNLLLTFKQVRNEVGQGNDIFTRASQAALDLGNVFGSTDGAAKQLGKALSDPVKGISALRKAGINFTDQQKEQIRILVASGKSLEAQKLILAEVESQVGGTAAATATDFDRMKVAIGNVAEDLGELLLPAFEAGARFVNEKVIPVFRQFSDIIGEKGLGAGFQFLGEKGLEALGKLKGWGALIYGVVAAVVALNVASGIYTALQVVATIVTAAFGVALNAAFMGIPALIGLVVVAFTALLLKFKGLRDFALPIIVAFANGFLDLFVNPFIRGINLVIGAYNLLPFVKDVSKIKEFNITLGKTADGMKKVASAADFRKFEGFNAGITPKPSASSGDTGGESALDKLKNKMKAYSDLVQKAADYQKQFADAVKNTTSANEGLEKATAKVTKAQELFNKVSQGYGAGSAEAKTAQEELEQAQRDATRAGFDLEQSTFAVTEAQKELAEAQQEGDPTTIRLAQIALAEAQMTVTEKTLALRDATAEVATAQSNLNGTVAGFPAESTKYKDALAELKTAQDEQTQAIDKVNDAKQRELETTNKLIAANKELAKKKLSISPKQAKAIAKSMKSQGITVTKEMFDILGIKPFAKGGIVTKPTLAMIGEGGESEAVIPLSRMGEFGMGGGDVYHIQINSKIADSTLPDLLVAELRKFNRRSGAIDIQVA
jgi:hypothetical protein